MFLNLTCGVRYSFSVTATNLVGSGGAATSPEVAQCSAHDLDHPVQCSFTVVLDCPLSSWPRDAVLQELASKLQVPSADLLRARVANHSAEATEISVRVSTYRADRPVLEERLLVMKQESLAGAITVGSVKVVAVVHIIFTDVATVGTVPSPTPEAESSSPWYENWVWWMLVGIGVALLGGGGWVGYRIYQRGCVVDWNQCWNFMYDMKKTVEEEEMMMLSSRHGEMGSTDDDMCPRCDYSLADCECESEGLYLNSQALTEEFDEGICALCDNAKSRCVCRKRRNVPMWRGGRLAL
eukprot:TRINITY_DN4617_c0_g1_i7.p1 TRINITY_DN4617_c0_g1~~TRINITY_DN4617_c0_g1_i7.p1  ORF type:complete len:296 (-),score=43.99 TRINITY_DN4617_c0_g1_i7:482-1369(-)